MAKSFKNIPSLHHLIDSAPIESVRDFLLRIDDRQYAACFADIVWPAADASDQVVEAARENTLQIAASLQGDAAVPLEKHAVRIMCLSEGRGVEVINRISGQIIDSDKTAAFAVQLYDYARAIFLYLNEDQLFDDAENLYYANYYRNFGMMYEAFEVDTAGELNFQWDDTIKVELERKLRKELDLSENCRIDHIRLTNDRDDSDEPDSHLLIIRHAGPLSSIAEMKNGRKKPIYYRPAVEATVMFSPKDAVVEVFAAHQGIRPIVASAFAEVGLKHSLSERPLTLRQYNLSRFLTSFGLDAPQVQGFDIESVTVVEVDVKPQNLRHRASLRVEIGDDIEAVATELFGPNSIFKRANVVSRITIAVRYAAAGETQTKTLNITVSEPNRCNLRSKRDPVQRDFGFQLLGHWGVMKKVRPLDASEVNSIFPALLRLYENASKDVSRQYLDNQGILPEPLQEGGFLVRKGRRNSIAVELDSGEIETVLVEPSTRPGYVRYQHPHSQRWNEILSQSLDYYEINRNWIKERVVKGLRDSLKPAGQLLQEHGLIFLGQLNLDAEQVPLYLARQMTDWRIVREYDAQLRAHQNAGIGIVLSCSDAGLRFLGPNVVVPLTEMLEADASEPTVDLGHLKNVYYQGKVLARGGQTVDFITNKNRSGTLFIPGKDALTLVGEKQITIVQRLVDAYHSGNPAVPTKDLMDGTGMQSPSQAFRHWKEAIHNIYIGQADKRGAWKLLI